jgi:hypothetical protein
MPQLAFTGNQFSNGDIVVQMDGQIKLKEGGAMFWGEDSENIVCPHVLALLRFNTEARRSRRVFDLSSLKLRQGKAG